MVEKIAACGSSYRKPCPTQELPKAVIFLRVYNTKCGNHSDSAGM